MRLLKDFDMYVALLCIFAYARFMRVDIVPFNRRRGNNEILVGNRNFHRDIRTAFRSNGADVTAKTNLPIW
jgi:hypothetical protein